MLQFYVKNVESQNLRNKIFDIACSLLYLILTNELGQMMDQNIYLMFAIPKCLTHMYKYKMMSQSNTNIIMFIIVLGQHVSILIESLSDPSKKIDPYLTC